jgi:hypothetical protein
LLFSRQTFSACLGPHPCRWGQFLGYAKPSLIDGDNSWGQQWTPLLRVGLGSPAAMPGLFFLPSSRGVSISILGVSSGNTLRGFRDWAEFLSTTVCAVAAARKKDARLCQQNVTEGYLPGEQGSVSRARAVALSSHI